MKASRRSRWAGGAIAAAIAGAGFAYAATGPNHGTRVVTTGTPETDPTVAAPDGTRCGTERWSVKVGTDPDAAKVNLGPAPATVAQLVALSSPVRGRAVLPRQPSEEQVYAVTGTLTVEKREADSDEHLVLTDGAAHMIVEVPAPACMGASPFRAAVSAVVIPPVGTRVRVTGVLFWDFAHGQTGVAPNAIELHPVLSIVPIPRA